MRSPVQIAWTRVELALTTLEIDGVALACGAGPAAISVFEEATGVRLPEEVRAFYGEHNGQTSMRAGLAGGFYFLSLNEVQKGLADWSEVRAKLGEGVKDLDRACSSHPPGTIQRKYSLPGWLPVVRDEEGNAIGVDLNPGPAGTVGQVINFGRDEDDKYVLFANLAEFLDWLATEFEAKHIVYDSEEDRVRHIEGRITGVMISHCQAPT